MHGVREGLISLHSGVKRDNYVSELIGWLMMRVSVSELVRSLFGSRLLVDPPGNANN